MPDTKQRECVIQLNAHPSDVYQLSEVDIVRARTLINHSCTGMGSLHLACAESCGVDVFLTTDDKLFRRAVNLAE